MSLLFLDFDGVLHPDRSLREPKFCRLRMLEAWLRRRREVQVVISSTWRVMHRFEELTFYFSDDLQMQLVGVTPLWHEVFENSPDTPAILLPYKRQGEIEWWVEHSWDPGQPWVALDDMPDLFRPGFDRLVVCDPKVGLTVENLAEVDLRLGLVGRGLKAEHEPTSSR